MNKIIPVVMILLVVSLTPAFAHTQLAVYPDNQRTASPLIISDTQKSQYTLEETVRVGQNHFYSFSGKAGDTIFMQIRVPDKEPYRDFRPSFDLLLGDDKTIALPVMERMHDDLTDTDWLVTAELTVLLDQDGLYQVRVHDELTHYQFGDVGKFSFVIGFEERFTIIDWILAPTWIAQMKLFFGESIQVIIWLMAIFVVFVGIWHVVTNRRR